MLARAARSGSVNCREKQLWLKCREDDEISFNNKGEKKEREIGGAAEFGYWN